MSGNTFGSIFKVTTFGESHGVALGLVLDGVPPGLELAEADIQIELDRRRPGQSEVSSARSEDDAVQIISGVFEGRTTGTALSMIVFNKDQRSRDYNNIKDIFRPGHADYSYSKKYGIRDYRGGGRSSGRETLARVAAGAVAKKILLQHDIEIKAFTMAAGGVCCDDIDFAAIEKNPMRAADLKAAEKMREKVLEAGRSLDSVGGIIECWVQGVPPGLGEPVFDKLDAQLAKAVLSIGGVKGIEFGSGFDVADMFGSEHNDQMDAGGFVSNYAGGILGGISNGQAIVFRAAVKPTASIARKQNTVDVNGREQSIEISGRHDPCLCPRMVPVIEAMSALTIVDCLMLQKAKS